MMRNVRDPWNLSRLRIISLCSGGTTPGGKARDGHGVGSTEPGPAPMGIRTGEELRRSVGFLRKKPKNRDDPNLRLGLGELGDRF